MSNFVSNMDTSANTFSRTENGQLSFTSKGINSDLLALYFKLVRGASKNYIISLFKQIEQNPQPQNIENLLVLVFQTRDIRCGKGERDLFYWMFCYLYENYENKLTKELLTLIPKYGSFKDLNILWESNIVSLQNDIIDLYISHIKRDQSSAPEYNNLSLAAKWAPRESGYYRFMARELANKYFSQYPGPNKKRYTYYRKLIANLNKRINTTEIHMAGNSWTNIQPNNVPARCMLIHRDAFQNKIHSGKSKGEQRSSKIDRIICASNFTEHLKNGNSLHGNILHPNDFIKHYYKSFSPNDIIEAQWKDTVQQYNTIFEEKIMKGEIVRNFIPVIDVSGSMLSSINSSVRPIEAAMGLGILLSELSIGPYKDRAITFSHIPEWINLSNCNSLYEKIINTRRAPWGMNTNLYKVFEMILIVAKIHNMSSEHLSNMDIIILSDMQFDISQSENDSWNTTLENITKMYNRAGYTKIPHIIFWNLCGNTLDFPEQSNRKNVTMISGFSPSAIKTILTEGIDSYKQNIKTPEDYLKEILEDERYNDIRYIYRSFIKNN